MGSGKSKTESLKYLARKHLAKEFPDLGFWSGNLKCFIVARNNGNLEHIGPFSYISNTDSRKVEYKIKERNYREAK